MLQRITRFLLWNDKRSAGLAFMLALTLTTGCSQEEPELPTSMEAQVAINVSHVDFMSRVEQYSWTGDYGSFLLSVVPQLKAGGDGGEDMVLLMYSVQLHGHGDGVAFGASISPESSIVPQTLVLSDGMEFTAVPTRPWGAVSNRSEIDLIGFEALAGFK